jgi:hypothetical protein
LAVPNPWNQTRRSRDDRVAPLGVGGSPVKSWPRRPDLGRLFCGGQAVYWPIMRHIPDIACAIFA